MQLAKDLLELARKKVCLSNKKVSEQRKDSKAEKLAMISDFLLSFRYKVSKMRRCLALSAHKELKFLLTQCFSSYSFLIKRKNQRDFFLLSSQLKRKHEEKPREVNSRTYRISKEATHTLRCLIKGHISTYLIFETLTPSPCFSCNKRKKFPPATLFFM